MITCAMQGSSLFYFKGETSEGLPDGNSLGVIPLEFALIEADQAIAAPDNTPSGNATWNIVLHISPVFRSRVKYHTYVLGVPTRESQVLHQLPFNQCMAC